MEEKLQIVMGILFTALAIMVTATLVFVGILSYKSLSNTGVHKYCDCSCSVSYGGHNMSVEDALERMGEGLTIDQWKEVQMMIDNALSESR